MSTTTSVDRDTGDYNMNLGELGSGISKIGTSRLLFYKNIGSNVGLKKT